MNGTFVWLFFATPRIQVGGRSCLESPGISPSQVRGLWDDSSRALPTAAKETQALLNTVKGLLSSTQNERVDAFVDNKVLLACWEKHVSRSPVISEILKTLFFFTMARKLRLTLFYVPSKDNPADAPSRVLSDIDCSLSNATWRVVDGTFGPHSIDLITLPSNVRRDPSGRPLPFYSPFPCPRSAGCNVFSQEICSEENTYIFPLFVLLGPLLRFLVSQSCAFTIIVPDISSRKYWWPLVQRLASGGFRLGSKRDRAVLLFPAKSALLLGKLVLSVGSLGISSCRVLSLSSSREFTSGENRKVSPILIDIV